MQKLFILISMLSFKLLATTKDFTLGLQLGPPECRISKGRVTVDQSAKKITIIGNDIICQTANESQALAERKSQCDEYKKNKALFEPTEFPRFLSVF